MSIFKKIFRRSKHGKDITAARAFGHWGLVLSIFVVSTILFSMFSAYLFSEITKGTIFTVEATEEKSSNTTLDRKKLEDTILYFEEKARDFEEFKEQSPRIPSVR